MPAEIVNGEYCASWFASYVVPSSSGTGEYTVTIGGAEGPAHCTCKAFEFAPEDRKECKHIRDVLERACMWNCQWHDGNAEVTLRPTTLDREPISRSACPNCGGPLVPVRIAV